MNQTRDESKSGATDYADIDRCLLPQTARPDIDDEVVEPVVRSKCCYIASATLLLGLLGVIIGAIKAGKDILKCPPNVDDGDDYDHSRFDPDCETQAFSAGIVLGEEIAAGLLVLFVLFLNRDVLAAAISNIPSSATACVTALQRLGQANPAEEIVIPYRPLAAAEENPTALI